MRRFDAILSFPLAPTHPRSQAICLEYGLSIDGSSACSSRFAQGKTDRREGLITIMFWRAATSAALDFS